jgi:hypothetical protein
MSNDIYPTLPGLSFGVLRSMIAPPVTIKTTPSQREYRARDSFVPRYKYTLPYEFLRSRAVYPELQTLVGFYGQHGGQFDSFLFKDPDDNTVTAQLFATGDGATTTFQLLRDFGGYSEPVFATDGPIQISSNGSRLNMIQGGNTFDLTPWADGGAPATVTPNTDVNPINGATDADTITDSSSTKQSIRYQNVPIQDGSDQSQYTGSVYVKKTSGGTSKTVCLQFAFNVGGTTALYRMMVNTDNGAVLATSGSPYQATVVDATTYWRLVITGPNNGTGNTALQLAIFPAWDVNGASGGTVSATGSAVFYGAKIELGVVLGGYTSRYFTWDWTTGITTISPAPANGDALTWTGSYYKRVRFDMDSFDATKFLKDFWEQKTVKLITVPN